MRTCKGCGKSFAPKHHLQSYCSVVCQRATKNRVWRWRKGFMAARKALIIERHRLRKEEKNEG